MRICLVSKYPPIEGGIAAKTFWLAKGFGEKGHLIHIVTNADCVEKEYFVEGNFPVTSKNISVHSVIPDIPWHIPYSELYIARLLDKTLEVISKYPIDIIDTTYLIPYGIVGYLASKISGIPYIVRHGGSDLAKFWQKGIFETLLKNVIQNAALVVSDDKNKELFKSLTAKVSVLPRYIPDEEYFKPFYTPHKIPVFAYIGKINYYWKDKSLDRIVDIFSGIEQNHKLIFVGQGKGFDNFLRYIKDHNLKTFELRKFVHPENMPALLSNVDYLLYFVQNNPIKDFSNIVCESLWSGTPLITDKTMVMDEYAEYTEVSAGNKPIVLDLDETETARIDISKIISSWQGPFRHNNKIKYDFSDYINANLKVYRAASIEKKAL